MDALSEDIRSAIEAEMERRLQPLQGEILLLKQRVDNLTAELEAVKSASESAKIAARDEEAKSPPKYPLGRYASRPPCFFL